MAGKGKELDEPGKEEVMVTKKGKTTKKMKDLGARKVTSAQAKRVKGGTTIGSATGGAGAGKVKSWIDTY